MFCKLDIISKRYLEISTNCSHQLSINSQLKTTVMSRSETIENVNIKIEIDLELVKKEPEYEDVVVKKEPEEVQVEMNNAMDIEIIVKEEPETCNDGLNIDESGINVSSDIPASTAPDPVHPENESNKCQLCHQTFPQPTILYTHNCTPKKNLQSHLENNIHKHISNIGKSMHTCNTCNIQFYNEINVNTHLYNVHVNGKVDALSYFQCEKCQMRFQSKRHLKEHESTHEVVVKSRRRKKRAEPKPNECDVCHKVFIIKASLKRHRRIHAPTQSFSCDICQKEMAYKSSLIKHMQLHMTQKKYPCDICQKRFAQPSTMKAHRRIHTGEKPYACDQCNMRFTDKSNLKKHKLIHMDIKPHSCEVCDKRFTDRRSLVGHMRSHTGEKPYFCSNCNTRFAYACALTKHIRNNRCEKKNRTKLDEG